MSNEYDQFADVQESWTGSLGGEGMDAFQAVKTIPTKDGAVFEFSCGVCGRGVQATVPWPAVMALKYGISPDVLAQHNQNFQSFRDERWGWDPKSSSWFPVDIRCPGCGKTDGLSRLRVSMQEPEKILATGRTRGYIPPQKEDQLSAFIASIAKRVRQQER